MSEAPDRIWACVSKNTKSGVVTLLGDATFPVDGWQEYIRADRIEAQAAEIERLAKDKRWIIDERDRTFALMLSRAEKAEAEIERLRGELAKAGRDLNMARYGQPDFAWSIHKQAMADIEAKLAKAVGALQSVMEACDQGRMIPRSGVGGMTIEANIKGSIYVGVPAWPIEEARTTLAELKGRDDE